MLKQHKYFMNQAILQAKKAEDIGEVPIGAVITDGEKVISRGYNRSIADHDPTAHAEVVAIRAAGCKLSNYRLDKLTMYVTLAPCPMCQAAITFARIKKVVYAAQVKEFKFNHKVQVVSGVLEEECSKMLKMFFKKKR
ncbi:MAG: nucleoside deaminase [bacterium]|nr:nucleoside deaminase [bacterium]